MDCPHGRKRRYLCQDCRTAYMREWRQTHPQSAYQREYRKTHPLTGEARLRANARAYAHQYVYRGKLEKKPCEVCGNPNSQMHHADYLKPLEVTWLCREHHKEVHRDDCARANGAVVRATPTGSQPLF